VNATAQEAILFVQISTDNQIKSDAEANERLEERVRGKLKRFESRLTHVEVHVSDVNGAKGGEDKRVSLELRANGHDPVAVHADAGRIDSAVTLAADKAVRALDHALGKLKDRKGH
jgi:ribosome-associated translation inhibitor RaiA